jgi:hypothetical protein
VGNKDLRDLAKRIEKQYDALPEWKKGGLVFDPPSPKSVVGEECPECGEMLVGHRIRPAYWSVGCAITHCIHCLWSERDGPQEEMLEARERLEEKRDS